MFLFLFSLEVGKNLRFLKQKTHTQKKEKSSCQSCQSYWFPKISLYRTTGSTPAGLAWRCLVKLSKEEGVVTNLAGKSRSGWKATSWNMHEYVWICMKCISNIVSEKFRQRFCGLFSESAKAKTHLPWFMQLMLSDTTELQAQDDRKSCQGHTTGSSALVYFSWVAQKTQV